MALPNIFTERVVGTSFAAAFALWAWYLNSLAGVVMTGVEQIRLDQKETQMQINALKTEIVQHQLYASEVGTRIQERQQRAAEWIAEHERHHEINKGWVK